MRYLEKESKGKEMAKYLKKRREYAFYGLVSPALLVFVIIFLAPFLYSMLISVSDSRSILRSEIELVGLHNFIRVLSQKSFWDTMARTILFVISTITIELIIGMTIALMLHRGLWGSVGFRLIYSLPLMVAPVVSGLQWRWLFADQYGVINALLNLVGLGGPQWFVSATAAFMTIIISNLWLATPFVVLVLVSGLSNISEELNEAAEIDGANKIQVFFHVVLPQLKPTILIILVIRITDAFRIYDLIYILTGGGPGGSTEVLSTSIYKQIFVKLDFGQGAAASLLVTILIFTLSVFLNKLFLRGGDDA